MTPQEKVRRAYRRGVKLHKVLGRLNKPCYIFSADYYVKDYRDILLSFGIEILGILDNDPRKWRKSCGGLPIMPVNSIIGKDAVVIVASGLWRSMIAQLERMGLKTGKEIIKITVSRSSTHNFLSVTELMLNCYLFWSGVLISKKIRNKYGKKRYFINHLPSLGDVYIASMFLPQIMNCSSVRELNCVLIVRNKGSYNLAKALGFRHIELITESRTKKIVYAALVSAGKTGIENLVFSMYPSSRHINYLDCHSDISFLDMFYPYLYKTDGVNKKTLPYFKPDLPGIDKFFCENNLLYGKTVIISPYAGSFNSDITAEIWRNLAGKLKENGYCVCTNSASEREPPIKGTIAVNFSFNDSVAFMERAGGFIGVRSGLCDIISVAKCIKIIIYETAIAYSGYFFSLNKMGLCNDAREYDFDGTNGKKLIDDIMKHFPYNLSAEQEG